jgi:hypothetical protein
MKEAAAYVVVEKTQKNAKKTHGGLAFIKTRIYTILYILERFRRLKKRRILKP